MEKNTQFSSEVSNLLRELNVKINPEILEVVEVSPELPSGGTSHCSGSQLPSGDGAM